MKKIFLILGFSTLLFFISCNQKTKINNNNSNLKQKKEKLATTGDSAFAAGDYSLALHCFSKLIYEFDWQNDSNKYFSHVLSIACVYDVIKEPEKARLMLQKSIDGFIRLKDTLQIGTAFSTASTIYGNQQNVSKATEMALEGMKYIKTQNDSLIIALGYNQLAFIHIDNQEFDKAIPYFETAISYIDVNKNQKYLASIYLNLADCYKDLKKYSLSLTYFDKALLIAEETDQNYIKNIILKNSSILQNQLHNAQNAYDLLYESSLIEQELFSKEKAEEISKIEIQYKTREKEDQIKRLKLESNIQLAKKNVTYLILTIIIITLFLIIYLIYLKLKNIKIELLGKEIELKNQIQKIVNQKYFSINNPQINTLSSNNDEDCDEIEINLLDLDDKFNNQIENDLLNSKIITNEDWENFKKQFSLIHKGYINKLRHKFPEITAAEERLFILLKIKLNNSEIAFMLGISVDSVKKTRQRLRKKLKINKNDNLENFIQHF